MYHLQVLLIGSSVDTLILKFTAAIIKCYMYQVPIIFICAYVCIYVMYDRSLNTLHLRTDALYMHITQKEINSYLLTGIQRSYLPLLNLSRYFSY